MIVTFLGENVKTYLKNYPAALAEKDLPCPICGGRCHYHGWYKRWVYDGMERLKVPILRVACRDCHRTHAVLPDFIRPYGRYSQKVREHAVTAVLTGFVTREQAGRASFVDPETIGRWVKELDQRMEQVASGLLSILARNRPECGALEPSGRRDKLRRPLCWMVAQGLKLAETLPAFPKSVGLFGLVNILLSWGGLRMWI